MAVPGPPVAAAAVSGKPDFSHLELNSKNNQSFHQYMEGRATQLANVIWEHTLDKTSGGVCLVCNTEFPANMASHIWGRNHWTRLKERLNWQEPRSPEDLERHTQFFALRAGAPQNGYRFNHVTGEQCFCLYPAELTGPAAAITEALPVAAPAPAPAAAAGAQVIAAIAATPPLAAELQAPQAASAAQGMAPGGASIGVGYAHSMEYSQALSSKEAWRAYMESPAKHLEAYLAKVTMRWDHPCKVCDKAMTRGAQDHLQSVNHWKTLWSKLQELNRASLPPGDVAKEPTRPWVQRYEVPGGVYAFNHLTGGQELEQGGPPSQASLSSSPALSSAAAPAAFAALQAGGPPPMAMPAAAAVQQPQAPAVAMPPAAGPGGSALVVGHGESYEAGLATKEAWKGFMAGPSKQLEVNLERLTQHWNHSCIVCGGKAMSRGSSDHLQSVNHWKQLWVRLQELDPKGSLPPPDVARDMQSQRPWHQIFELPGGGRYVFNHLTGAQLHVPGNGGGGGGGGGPVTPGLASEAQPQQPMQPQQMQQPPQPPAKAPPASLRPPAPAKAPPGHIGAAPPIEQHRVGADGSCGGGLVASLPTAQDARIVDPRLPVRNGIGYRTAMEDKESWKKFMDAPARQLENFIYKALPHYSDQCPVCLTNMNGVVNHLLSQNHFKKMWAKMPHVPDAQSVINWQSPWVQAFHIGSRIYLYNHLTGEQAWRDELSSPTAPPPSSATAAAAAALPVPAAPAAPAPAAAGVPPPAGAQPAPMGPPTSLAPPSPVHTAAAPPAVPVLQPSAAAAPPPSAAGGGGDGAAAQSPIDILMDDRRLASPPAPAAPAAVAAAAAAAPPPAAAVPPLPNGGYPTNGAAAAGVAAASVAGGVRSAGAGGFEHWHWRCLVHRPARALGAALGQAADGPSSDPWDAGAVAAPQARCVVCQVDFESAEEHLSSWEHYAEFRKKMEAQAAHMQYQADKDFLASRGPWVQDFGCGIVFNHLTLSLEASNAAEGGHQ